MVTDTGPGAHEGVQSYINASIVQATREKYIVQAQEYYELTVKARL